MHDELEQALAGYAWRELPAVPGHTNHIRCGVVIPLILAPEPTCYAGVRSTQLTNHAGEVCFPGGRPEAGDADLQATALREAREEMGLSEINIIGRLSSMPLYTSNYRLEPFVGLTAEAGARPDGQEIVEVVRIRLHDLCTRPSIPGIPWEHQGKKNLSPLFELGSHIMFGATAHVFLEFLTVLGPVLGLSVPPLAQGNYRWEDFLEIS